MKTENIMSIVSFPFSDAVSKHASGIYMVEQLFHVYFDLKITASAYLISVT